MSKDSDDRNLFDGFGGSPPPAQKPGGRKVQPAAATNQTAQVPDARQMKLAGLSKSVADHEWLLDRRDLSIGSSPENDIVIEDRSISDTHARLHFDGTDYVLEDLGSDTGVRVNSEKFRRFCLRQNDLIMIGAVRCRFVRPGDTVEADARAGEKSVMAMYRRREAWLTPARKRKIALVCAVIGLVAVGAIGYLVFRDRGPLDERGRLIDLDARSAESQLLERLNEGDRLIRERRWEEARVVFEQVRVASERVSRPAHVRALNALDRIQRELVASPKLEAVEALVRQGKPDQAYELLTASLAELSSETVQYEKLQALKPSLAKRAVEALVDRGYHERDKKRRFKEAQRLARAALAIEPGHERAKKLLRSLRRREGAGSEGDEDEIVEYVVVDGEQREVRARDGKLGAWNDTDLLPVKDKKPQGGRGRLAKGEVQRVVQAHDAEVRWCYARGLEQNPDLMGRVTIEWTINPEGQVRKAHVKSGDLSEPGVAECIRKKITRWSFPRPRGGEVVVNYPFSFEAL